MIDAFTALRNPTSPEKEGYLVCQFASTANCDTLEVTSSGTTFKDFREALPANDVAYALLKRSYTHEVLSGSVAAVTTKFVFVRWFPEGVSIKRKMKVGSIEGAVKKVFESFHGDIQASEISEVAEDIVVKLLEDIGGKTNRSEGVQKVVAKTVVEKRSFVGGMDGKTQDMQFVDESALKGGISSVRDNDQPSVDFVIADFDLTSTPPKLQIKCQGGGSVDAMNAAFSTDSFNYGLVRLTEQIDKSLVVKFCYVRSQPEATPFRTKGKLGVLTGAVAKVFAPAHGDVLIDGSEPLTQSMIVEATRKR